MAGEVERAQEDVELERTITKDFGEPALARSAHHFHLPQPILGMGEPEAPIKIGRACACDVRHRIPVPHDGHGLCESRYLEGAAQRRHRAADDDGQNPNRGCDDQTSAEERASCPDPSPLHAAFRSS